MPTEASATTILIIDDHPIYLDGISYILQSLFENVNLLQAHCSADALKLVSERIDIDWIFLDYQLPDNTGTRLLDQFNALLVSAPVIMMSGHDDLALIVEALELGASGFIHKAFGRDTFAECLERVQAGHIYLPPDLQPGVEHYRNTVMQARNVIKAQLSSRRQEILVLMSEGYTNSEVATSLGIAEATVKTHVSALLTIFDVDNRSHCVAEARKLGLLK